MQASYGIQAIAKDMSTYTGTQALYSAASRDVLETHLLCCVLCLDAFIPQLTGVLNCGHT